MGKSKQQAIACSFPSDNVTIVTESNGTKRYFRSDDSEQEEYSYKKPFILELEITRRCNLKCVHCYADADDCHFDDELSFAQFSQVLEDGRELGIRELSLTGGEVFLHPDFLKIIDTGLEKNFHVRFVTNATLLTDHLLDELCIRPIKMITVSLDSINPHIHDEIRGSGSNKAAIEGIAKLRNAGFKISIITAFSSINICEFDPLLKYCIENDFDWQVQLTSAKGRCHKGITLSPEEYYRLGQKVASAYVDDLPINIIPMDDLATFSLFPPLNILSSTWQQMCTGGLLNIFVRANGDVTPCSALAFPESIVGNLHHDSLKDICIEERCKSNLSWLSPENLTGACQGCTFIDKCRGGCPEILISMCKQRTENEYCYYRIEQNDIIQDLYNDI